MSSDAALMQQTPVVLIYTPTIVSYDLSSSTPARKHHRKDFKLAYHQWRLVIVFSVYFMD